MKRLLCWLYGCRGEQVAEDGWVKCGRCGADTGEDRFRFWSLRDELRRFWRGRRLLRWCIRCERPMVLTRSWACCDACLERTLPF